MMTLENHGLQLVGDISQKKPFLPNFQLSGKNSPLPINLLKQKEIIRSGLEKSQGSEAQLGGGIVAK